MKYMLDRTVEYAKRYGLISTLKKVMLRANEKIRNNIFSVNLIDKLSYKTSISRLGKLKRKEEKNIKDIIKSTKKFSGIGLYKSISPQQDEYELVELAKRVKKKSPKYVLEIGTAEGGTLYVWSRYLDSVNKIVSIDIGKAYEKRTKFFSKFSARKKYKFINNYSQKRNTIDKVKEEMDKGVDFLFIDGDHTYKGVKKDFDLYKGMVNKGGVIAFHDIIETGYSKMGVPKLWSEIEDIYRTEEIIRKDGNKQGGIGLLYK